MYISTHDVSQILFIHTLHYVTTYTKHKNTIHAQTKSPTRPILIRRCNSNDDTQSCVYSNNTVGVICQPFACRLVVTTKSRGWGNVWSGARQEN